MKKKIGRRGSNIFIFRKKLIKDIIWMGNSLNFSKIIVLSQETRNVKTKYIGRLACYGLRT